VQPATFKVSSPFSFPLLPANPSAQGVYHRCAEGAQYLPAPHPAL